MILDCNLGSYSLCLWLKFQAYTSTAFQVGVSGFPEYLALSAMALTGLARPPVFPVIPVKTVNSSHIFGTGGILLYFDKNLLYFL